VARIETYEFDQAALLAAAQRKRYDAKALAAAAGVCPGTVRRLMGQHIPPSMTPERAGRIQAETARRLARVLGVSTKTLVPVMGAEAINPSSKRRQA
jgi:hypothetical protein